MRFLLATLITLLAVSPTLHAQSVNTELNKHDIQSYRLKSATADEVVGILNEQFLGGAKFSGNTVTNTVYGRVPDDAKKEIQDFIEQLEKHAAARAEETRQRLQDSYSETQEDRLETIMIKLKHADPIEIMVILNELDYDGLKSVALGPSAGSLIASGTKVGIAELGNLINMVDIPGAENSQQNVNKSRVRLLQHVLPLEIEHRKMLEQFGSNHPSTKQLQSRIAIKRKQIASATQGDSAQLATKGGTAGATGSSNLSPARTAYENAEREAAKFADRWRREKAKGKLSDEEMKSLSELVTQQVSTAFKLRQQQKRAEWEKAAEQLEMIRKRLDLRQRISEKIVQRRVEDLLSGVDLSWLSVEDRAENDLELSSEEPPSKLGDVQVQVIEDLGTVILRGKKEDVKKIMNVVQKIEETSSKQSSRDNETEKPVDKAQDSSDEKGSASVTSPVSEER